MTNSNAQEVPDFCTIDNDENIEKALKIIKEKIYHERNKLKEYGTLMILTPSIDDLLEKISLLPEHNIYSKFGNTTQSIPDVYTKLNKVQPGNDYNLNNFYLVLITDIFLYHTIYLPNRLV